MSRTIDRNDPNSWSDEDVVYMRDRGQLPEDYELPRHLRIVAPESPALDEVPYTGDVNTYPRTTTGGPADTDDDVGAFVAEEDYDSMSKAQLQAEARMRGLDDSGTKQDIIDRLVESDQGA